MSLLKHFNQAQAALIMGINHQTLHYWTKTDFLAPSSEHPKRFSFTDLVAGRVAVRLRKQGIPLQRLRKVVEILRELDIGNGKKHPLAEHVVVVLGEDVQLVDSKGLVSLLARPGQRGLVGVVDVLQEIEMAAEGRDYLSRAAM